MKKMKKILAFCLCAMLMTTVPTFTETASAATTSTKTANTLQAVIRSANMFIFLIKTDLKHRKTQPTRVYSTLLTTTHM